MDTTENPIVALFDLDGTLADYTGELRRRLGLMRSPNDPDLDPNVFRHDGEPDWLRQRRKMIQNVPGFWSSLPRLEAGFEILEQAHRLHFQIEVLTKGPRQSPIAWMEKVQWCDQHLAAFPHQITITMDKGLVYGRLLVDDWPDYVLRWLRWRKRGTVVMPDQPWNQDFQHPQVYRYRGDSAELTAILQGVADRARAPSAAEQE